MATENRPSSMGKMKSSNLDGFSKGKVDSSSLNKKKIVITSSKHPIDSKQKSSASAVTKTEVILQSDF